MGACITSRCQPLRRRSDSGITLVEMLVVLAVIAVAAGVVMLRFPGNAGTTPATEAVALALALTTASDQALTSGRPRSLDWAEDGYRVLHWLPGSGWVAEPGTVRALAPASALTRSDGAAAGPVLIGTDALTAPATFTLGTGTAAWVVAFDGLAARAQPEAAP